MSLVSGSIYSAAYKWKRPYCSNLSAAGVLEHIRAYFFPLDFCLCMFRIFFCGPKAEFVTSFCDSVPINSTCPKFVILSSWGEGGET